MRIYLDSNVFISLFERETGSNIRGLFVEAELFLEKVVKEGHCIVLSEWFFAEAMKRSYLNRSEITGYFEKSNIKIEFTPKVQGNIGVSSFTRLGIHYADALHIALALHFKCNCIVTFNVRDFGKAGHLIKVLEPAEF